MAEERGRRALIRKVHWPKDKEDKGSRQIQGRIIFGCLILMGIPPQPLKNVFSEEEVTALRVPLQPLVEKFGRVVFDGPPNIQQVH